MVCDFHQWNKTFKAVPLAILHKARSENRCARVNVFGTLKLKPKHKQNTRTLFSLMLVERLCYEAVRPVGAPAHSDAIDYRHDSERRSGDQQQRLRLLTSVQRRRFVTELNKAQ